MAASPLRRVTRVLIAVVGALALVVIGYPLAAWVGSSIPESVPAALPDDADTIEIMVETNGTHTSIVVPVVSATKDWREDFPSAAMPRPDGSLPTHLSIGWGEREVFLHVPTWGDLKVSTALRIATVGGEPLMRVSHYLRPQPSPNHRPVRITVAQYERLVAAIERPLPEMPAGESRQILQGTYADDAYYEADGSYTMANTCNTWVGDTLAEAGVEMGMWTPLAGGVMKWIPQPEPAT
ncbi:DUF2459 domain-containing protein [Aurantiacibacter sp. MUD11]|uniref:DUF2459 domain-containing protein n=1 Tax=Aurantiacibacter sp. MUD11 TaxID=3003265 RepID=UPI0022AA7739|nr:DUF2459 domain-containing protein [Aurantiacibacter sp. MUD11]WAT18140.1 DUF2459 domain-containing protein [Aurantiacibacter sp. MUD11]